MYLFEGLINAVVIGYLVVVVAAVAVAMIKPKRRSTKVIATTIVLAVLVGPFAYAGLDNYLRTSKARKQFEVAEAMFQERCKGAGVKIHRTDHDVDGVFLLKLRPEGTNYGQQFALTDPYGKDYGGDGYIRSFLRGFEKPRTEPPYRLGYLYVEAIDPKDGAAVSVYRLDAGGWTKGSHGIQRSRRARTKSGLRPEQLRVWTDQSAGAGRAATLWGHLRRHLHASRPRALDCRQLLEIGRSAQ